MHQVAEGPRVLHPRWPDAHMESICFLLTSTSFQALRLADRKLPGSNYKISTNVDAQFINPLPLMGIRVGIQGP